DTDALPVTTSPLFAARAKASQIASLQLGQQGLGLLEIPRIEAFAETAVDGFENVARLGALVLTPPEHREVGCRPKLERSRLLAACYLQSLVKQGLSLGVRRTAREHRAGLESIQFGLKKPFAVAADDREPVIDQLQRRLGFVAEQQDLTQ